MFRILVVDDDLHTQKLIKTVLENENYKVITACNGLEALDVIDREYIDLVVLDVMMPQMNGYEFTSSLREGNNNLYNNKNSFCGRTTSIPFLDTVNEL